MRIAFFLGLGSRYSWLASTQIDRIAAETGGEIEWLPLDSGALIRRARGGASPFDAPFGIYAEDWRERDAIRWADHFGVPYQRPRLDGLAPDALALAAWSAPTDSRRAALCRALMETIFAQGRAMTPELIARIAASRGVTLDPTTAADRHNAALDRAHAAGAFGVPSFHARGELFFGNDRLPLLRDFLAPPDRFAR